MCIRDSTALAAFAHASAATTSTNPIVTRALRDLGTYQGECWTWMKQVVQDSTGAKVGFDYRFGYLDAGAVEVALKDAGQGDIIQIANDAWSTADADYDGLHTAIIISVNRDGTFEIIDSNQNWDGMVNLRSGYDPAARAAAKGLNFHVYRFGAGSSSVPAKPVVTVAGPVAAGDLARVNTPGDCLRLRNAPAGTITNSYGGLNEDETWGKRAHWCDYSGTIDGVHAGIAILDHPRNLGHPVYWHVRNYGLMTANPFGVSHFEPESGKRGDWVMPAQSDVTFRYRLYVHAGDAARGRVREAYHDYVNPPHCSVASEG